MANELPESITRNPRSLTVMRPTTRTLFWRTFAPWQLLCFIIINLRISMMILKRAPLEAALQPRPFSASFTSSGQKVMSGEQSAAVIKTVSSGPRSCGSAHNAGSVHLVAHLSLASPRAVSVTWSAKR